MLEPLGFRVLIKPDPIDDEHDLGDGRSLKIVTDENREKAAQIVGTVVSVGPLAWKDYNKNYENAEPWAVKGDRVLYSKYGGKHVKDPETEEEYTILNDEDVLCKVFEKESKE